MIVIRIQGGLGNQMFQHALARAFQQRNVNVVLDTSRYRSEKDHNGFELERVFPGILHRRISRSIWRAVLRISLPDIYEQSAEYDPSVLNASRGILRGYWQSPIYFNSVEDQVRRDFEFQPFRERNDTKLKRQIAEQPHAVSIHVRRGDYVGHQELGGICTVPYYRQAIRMMQQRFPKARFFLFSDDISWCLQNLPLPASTIPVTHNQQMSSFRDMQLISLCNHHIIANSSFSWWAAWLNNKPNRFVISPSRWIRHQDMGTLILPNWLTVSAQGQVCGASSTLQAA